MSPGQTNNPSTKPDSAQTKFIYLDQNILGLIDSGKLKLRSVDEAQWVYSFEHFSEIARGNCTSLLSVLKDLRARQIEVVVDELSRITDQARVHVYSCPFERYEQHLEAVGDVPVDEALFTDFLSGLFGADNLVRTAELPDKLQRQVELLLDQYGESGEQLRIRAQDTALDLKNMIERKLVFGTPLESSRKAIGTDKGRIGNPHTSNPILEIWDVVKAQAPGLSIDQFFGFEPPDKQNCERWPMYLGIVGCYTVLNFVGFRTDKGVAKYGNMAGIMSDATHVAHAAFCAGLISEDYRLCGKAKAIYQYLGVNTEVVRVKFKKNQKDSGKCN